MKPNLREISTAERLLQQRAALKKNRQILPKLFKIGVVPPVHAPKTRSQVPLESTQPNAPTAALPNQILEDEPARASIGFNLFRDIDSAPLKVSKTVEQLAQHLLNTSVGKVEVALLWPGSLRSLASIHAVATISRWHGGDKRGIRTLIYPARANIFQDLNHALLDRLALAKLYAEMHEPPGGKNPKVLVSCREKDAFFTALRSVKSKTGGELQPTIGEVLPHYFSDQEFKGWVSCEGNLLKNLKTRLGDVNHTKALNMSAIPVLGAPDYAPDAVFALGWRTAEIDLEKALKQLKRLRGPNAILVDLTRAARKNNPKWLRATVKFLKLVAAVWPNDRPGICIVADEPHLRNQLAQEFTRQAEKAQPTAGAKFNPALAVCGFPCAATLDGFFPLNALEPLSPQTRDIRVGVTDTHASELIAQVDRLKKTETDVSSNNLLAEVSRYLSRLASLPSSTRALMDWLNQTGMPMAVRETYTWPSYRSKLQKLFSNPDFMEKKRLERIVKRCDEMWAAYENGTPFARQLADLIEEHTRGTEKCCVVFTRPTAKRLAERYFETYDGYPEGAGFEVLKDCVRMVVSGSLEAELGAGRTETLIFAGLDETSLRSLMLDDRISSRSYVLLTTRNAAYLKATLSAIDQLAAFKGLSTRVKPLLKQLPNFQGAAERQFMTREDFVLPTFSFEQGLSATISEDESSDPDAWELVLDEGRTLHRSPSSRVYVFDPLYGYTPTRGFRGTAVQSLQVGQRLFVMSAELRELTESCLKEAGVNISHDKQFEASLHQYHSRVLRGVDETLKKGSLKVQARELHARLTSAPDAPKGLPAESAMRHWLDVSGHLTAVFEEQTSQAPRQEGHFKAFAKAIGFNDLEAVYFWKVVIQPLRGTRRADGRRVAEAYSDMLMEPESAIAHGRLKPAVVAHLFSRAVENVYTLESIKKPPSKDPDA